VEGTGIGLAIVARATEQMGGACGVESTPGKGSQFWLEFAIADQPAGMQLAV
jgi:signal transduction histidine kinase